MTVHPAVEKALLFFTSYEDGMPDVRTLHRVALDAKRIAQVWIHDVGNCQKDAMEGVEEAWRRRE